MLTLSAEDIWTFGTNGDLLAALNTAGVRYLVVGGVAVRFYVQERQPEDLDLLLDNTLENVERFAAVLVGQGLQPLSVEKVVTGGPTQIRLKVFHNADVVTLERGFDFDAAWADAVEGRVNQKPVRFISRARLIELKHKSDRPKDVEDLRLLTGGQ